MISLMWIGILVKWFGLMKWRSNVLLCPYSLLYALVFFSHSSSLELLFSCCLILYVICLIFFFPMVFCGAQVPGFQSRIFLISTSAYCSLPSKKFLLSPLCQQASLCKDFQVCRGHVVSSNPIPLCHWTIVFSLKSPLTFAFEIFKNSRLSSKSESIL